MNLSNLKKDELIALAETHEISLDPDWNKKEILEALSEYDFDDIEETETVVDNATETETQPHDKHAEKPEGVKHDKHAPK